MFALLEAFAGLNPKAIEKIDPASARLNPTIAGQSFAGQRLRDAFT
jgi:hypothetical protein